MGMQIAPCAHRQLLPEPLPQSRRWTTNASLVAPRDARSFNLRLHGVVPQERGTGRGQGPLRAGRAAEALLVLID